MRIEAITNTASKVLEEISYPCVYSDQENCYLLGPDAKANVPMVFWIARKKFLVLGG